MEIEDDEMLKVRSKRRFPATINALLFATLLPLSQVTLATVIPDNYHGADGRSPIGRPAAVVARDVQCPPDLIE